MSYCMYCDEPYRNEPFKIGYAERVRSILFPWKYVHKVPETVIESNLVGSWPVAVYHRERCTK